MNNPVASAASASTLIIAPHPDDDLLYGSGIAYSAVAMGESVKVVFITNGDRTGISTGYLRQNEAVTGQSRLGLDENSLIFLGYPDVGLTKIFHFYQNDTDIFTSHNGQRTTYGNRGLGSADYHTYRWGIPATYNRHNIVQDLQDVLLTYKPTRIITTSEFDRHGDHSTTYELLRLALTNANFQDPQYNPVIYKTIVHWAHGTWPNGGDAEAPFPEIPNLYENTGLDWNERASLDLPHQAVTRKVNAISAHRSQNGFSGKLGRYIYKDEIFWVERLFGGELPAISSAGVAQSVNERDFVVLDGSESRGGHGTILNFQWNQVAGAAVELMDSTTAHPSFIAPQGLKEHERLIFRLVADDSGVAGLPDFAEVKVLATNPKYQ